MMQIEPTHLVRVKELLDQGIPPLEALLKTVGGTDACNGLWRFYSESWPTGGIRHWNSESQWKKHWESCLPEGTFAFGEDVFGNQLIVVLSDDHVYLWNHENGDCLDLYADPFNLIAAVLKDGIDWVDHYSDGSLGVASRFIPVARGSHLHWTTPLILGGVVSESNISVVEREPHLVGHAKLWTQVRDLPPGTMVAPKYS